VLAVSTWFFLTKPITSGILRPQLLDSAGAPDMATPDSPFPPSELVPPPTDKLRTLLNSGWLGRLIQRITPTPRTALVLLPLFVIAVAFGWPLWVSLMLAGFFIVSLIVHFTPKQIADVLKWLRENLKLATVSALVTISGFLVLNYTNGLRQELDLIKSGADAERIQSAEIIRNRDDKIQNLLFATKNVPVLLSPHNARSRAAVPRIVLHWASDPPNEHYLVEITRFDGSGTSVTGTIPATNPEQMSSTYPSGLIDPIEAGTYFWRVAAGDFDEGRPSPQGSWSGYYRFDFFPSAIERIHHNHRLTVGVTYNQNSDFMRRDEDGAAFGFDAELLKELSARLSGDNQLNIDSSKWRTPDIIEYTSIDALLRTGVKGGEVDFALSSITKTRYREKLGIRFTQGYFDSHLVLLARRGVSSKSLKDTEVGFIEKTTNAYAAKELCRSQQCAAVAFKSFQDTVNALEDGAVQFILADEALSLQMIQHKLVTVVMHDLAKQLPAYRLQIGYPKEEYAIATPDENVQAKLKKVLDDLSRDGTLRRLMEKYHLSEDGQSRP
jgi:ABC-type amino acid transport substrate-binding protein